MEQPRADEALRLRVGLRLVAVASRATRPVEVTAQVVAGLPRGGQRDVEGGAQVQRGQRSGSGVLPAAAASGRGRNSRQATTGCGG